MRKNMKLILSSVIGLVFASVIFTACQKSGIKNDDGQAVAIYLTDHPGEFQNLFIQITKVEAKLDTGKHRHDDARGDKPNDFDHDGDDHGRHHDEFGKWTDLTFRAGTYDVLALRNGIDTLLATGTVTGTIRKIRISVGTMSVVKNGVTYPVELMPGQTNYIYVHVRKDHMHDSSGVKKLHLDFDVARSIVEANGKFYLKPVMKPFSDLTSGAVEGVVLPIDAKATVKLFSNTDTAIAIPSHEGRYKIRGLTEGTFNVLVTSANGYKNATLSAIVVTKGRVTKIPVITLIK